VGAQRSIWIPADRFLAVVDRAGIENLGRRGTNLQRHLHRLRSGEQRFISLDSADKILTRLDLADWFHIPKDQGGLADIYEDGLQYGSPGRPTNNRPPVPIRKYATHEERLAARRLRYQEQKREAA
jgi:hypothetical protein